MTSPKNKELKKPIPLDTWAVCLIISVKSFSRFFCYESMGANDPRGMANIGPQGHGWQVLMYGTIICINHCYILNI